MDTGLELIGRVLLDRYDVEEEIGQGASSVVYRARDRRHPRDVAVKVLRRDVAGAIGSARFLREIQFAASLQHPHILPLYDSGEVEGLPFYVMPFVEGRSLRDELTRRGALPVEEAAVIAGEIGSALAYAHRQGLIHRDIKPENVLLTAGHAVVADFGIARALAAAGGETLTSAGIALGTPRYMAPEQFDGVAVDERSDVYAMGCVVYEMLTGSPPYAGSTPQVLLARHATYPIPAPRDARADVPREMSTAVTRSLQKPPERRFASAEEFTEALRPFATGGAPERRVPWRSIAAGVVLAGLVTAYAVERLSTEPPDDLKVMVFPLHEVGLPGSLDGSGYDVSLLVGAAMEQTDPLRWVEAAPRMSADQRAAVGDLTARQLGAIALQARARYFVDGVVMADRDSVRVTLRLNDALGDSVVDRRTSSARATEATPSTLALVGLPSLLASLLEPDHPIDLSPLSSRDPGAIALFIQGEREYRRGRYGPALDFFRRAVEEDSAFAFASARGAMAASWQSDLQSALSLSARATRFADLLPYAHRLFARGLGAFWRGNADSAVAIMKTVVDTAGEWADAHAVLGDIYYHLLPSSGQMGDSIAKIEFDSARALDPQLSQPLFHLAQIHLRQGHPDSAYALLRSMEVVSQGAEVPAELEYAVECAREGADSATWARWAREDSLGALAAASTLAKGYTNPACAEMGFRALWATSPPGSAFAFASVLGLQSLMAASERWDEVTAVLDSAFATGQLHAISLFIMNTVAGAPLESQATVGDQFARDMFGEDYGGIGQPFTTYVFGIWNAHRGDVETTRSLYERLGAIARSSGSPFDEVLAQALSAHLALAEGDSAGAIRRLRALRPVSPQTTMDFGMGEALPVERILLAQLLLAEGSYVDAERVAAGFDHPEPLIYVAFLGASLKIRIAAADALGESRSAAAYRSRLAGLRK